MKRSIVAAGAIVVLFSIAQFVAPAEAQDVAATCRAKYGLSPKDRMGASEARRKESEQRVAACIKSGGKN